MILQILLFVFGLLILIKGADLLVDGASVLAKKYGISNLTIGLTVVAFGTSAPELVVNSIASFQDHKDIVLGNIIGSNNVNLFLILGITGLITPLAVQSSTVRIEIPISFGAVLLTYILANDHITGKAPLISGIDGIIILLFFGLFLFYVYKQLKSAKAENTPDEKQYSGLKTGALIVLGFIGLTLGGKFVVDNAIEIATAFGISEKVIGLTIIAAGTSLPELATSVAAAFKKNADIAVGNIIGSNIFNLLFVLGVSSLVNPIEYNIVFNTDLYLLSFGTLILFLAMFTGKRKVLDKAEAAVLLTIYIAYTVYLLT